VDGIWGTVFGKISMTVDLYGNEDITMSINCRAKTEIGIPISN
jgi:hypothetical protein